MSMASLFWFGGYLTSGSGAEQDGLTPYHHSRKASVAAIDKAHDVGRDTYEFGPLDF